MLQSCRNFSARGEVAERLKATVSKTVKPHTGLQGFKSLPLRQMPRIFPRPGAAFKPRYLWLVITQVILIVLSPLFSEFSAFGSVLVVLLETLIPIAISLAFVRDRKRFHWVVAMALCFILVDWIAWFITGNPLLRLVSPALGAIFFLFAIVLILRHILTQKSVTADILLGGISVYFLLGNLWAFFYTLIERLYPHSFVSAHSIDLLYLSFVALTSTGYGDMVAVTAVARSAVILESVTGVLFIAILVGRLVGMFIYQRGEFMDSAASPRLISSEKPSFLRKRGRYFSNHRSRRRGLPGRINSANKSAKG